MDMIDDQVVSDPPPEGTTRRIGPRRLVARCSLLAGVGSLLILVLMTPFVASSAAAAERQRTESVSTVSELPGIEPALELETTGSTRSATGSVADTSISTSGGVAAVTTKAGGHGFSFSAIDEQPLTRGASDRHVERARNAGSEYSTIVKSDGFPQVLVTLTTREREHRKVFAFDTNTRLALTATGGVSVTNRRGEEIATIATPWAVDRTGRAVVTEFKVSADGRKLIQIVRPDATTAYPIVADPNVNCGIVTCSLYLTRAETANLWARLRQYDGSSYAAIAGASAIACSVAVAPVSGPFAVVAGVVCAAAGAVYGSFFLDKLKQSANSGNCLRIRYTSPYGVPTPNFLYNDNSQYCMK